MFSKRKWPTWEGILVIILLLIAIFSLGFLSETVAEKMVEIT